MFIKVRSAKLKHNGDAHKEWQNETIWDEHENNLRDIFYCTSSGNASFGYLHTAAFKSHLFFERGTVTAWSTSKLHTNYLAVLHINKRNFPAHIKLCQNFFLLLINDEHLSSRARIWKWVKHKKAKHKHK